MDTSEETSLTWTPCPATPAPASPLALVSWYDLSRYRTRQDESFARVWRMGKWWGHLVTFFFLCWIFVSVVVENFGSKHEMRKKKDGQLILSFTEPFPHSNWCTTVPCPASTKSTERERGSGRLGQNAPNMTLYWNHFHQLSMLCQAVFELTLMNHDEPSIFRHQSHLRHPLFQEHGLVVERRNGYVRLTLVRLKHTVMESGNPRALEQI